ncbi:MAG TPA: cupin domain-containing protein [Solirubrobacterales bacterium]|nr:cupin domain-containing protein [Solirubrobacterales bacterium]
MSAIDVRKRPAEPFAVRLEDLTPSWHTAKAKEPGHLRWLVTYVGGPAGYPNANPDTGIVSDRIVLGMMRLYAGNRQFGVHTHGVAEIYVIVRGEVESIEAGGITRRAGPMDCVYIPAGAPHGVRAVGDADVDLIWLHDDLEKRGTARYVEEAGLDAGTDYPRVSVVRWADLEPRWVAEGAKEGGHMRRHVSYVGGAPGLLNLNPEAAARSERVALGAMVMTRGNSQVPHSNPLCEMYVVTKGRARVVGRPEIAALGPLDALIVPPDTEHALRSVGDEDLELIWVHDELIAAGAAAQPSAA